MTSASTRSRRARPAHAPACARERFLTCRQPSPLLPSTASRQCRSCSTSGWTCTLSTPTKTWPASSTVLQACVAESAGSRCLLHRSARFGLAEAKDRFLDLLVSRVGERDRRAYDRESCPLQHLERSHIVTRGAGEHWPHANRFQEQGERSAGDALPPEGPVDPVCDLGIAINDEAGDAAHEPSIDGDRTGGRLWQRPDLRHVDIERGAVVGIFGREGGHPDRLGIPHLFEQGTEVGVVDRPQRHLSHKYPPTLVQRRSAGRTYQHHRIIGEDSTSASAACRSGVRQTVWPVNSIPSRMIAR